ncbi:PaaI family thioesterase [Oxalobacteraceae bacterium OM1]|nr:PaaI family thioesterase [Oxalobacteraceae bacterium OM1]
MTRTPEDFNAAGAGYLPGHLGIRITQLEKSHVHAELEVKHALLAPNGFLHAGTVVTLADTACGYACMAHLPEGAESFTTIELKSNFMGTAREGTVTAEAMPVHMGRNTQVWDAVVRHRQTNKLMATFRCTQMILYPKAKT